ncbi:MAG: glucose-6-phosphate isomerase family protein [Enterococcus sp.]|uniref:glucose-6-phosphate isomerase family protein n=1 Tax=Enterococcus sp. TaxID=35783 RepID=UPI002FC85146
MIKKSDVMYNGTAFQLEGIGIQKKEIRAKDLAGYFLDSKAYQKLDPEKVIYCVEFQDNGLAEGASGGLYFGITHLYPGVVGSEYFLTKGHVHSKRNTGEYYFGLEGKGLLMMTENVGSL